MAYKDKQQALEYGRKYYHTNKDKRKSIVKAYYQQYHDTHLEEHRQRSKEWYYNNKERAALKGKLNYVNNRERELERAKQRRLENRAKVIEAYGGKCVWCSQSNPMFLTIDHIHNDGAEHRRQMKRDSINTWLVKNKFPKDNFQLLCMNCNFAKGKYGYNPHKEAYNDLLVYNV